MFLIFHQAYQPVSGSVVLSALVAAIPLVVLFVMLAVLRMAAWMSALAAAAVAFLLAWFVWGMPLQLTASATTQGMAFGLWPISWVVLNAVFFHNLTVASGDFDVLRRTLGRLTEDRRVQALLVAFCFGALLEGIAGFGAPVAISASVLAGLGFEPVTAAVLALLANTAPVAFGSIGIPVVTLGGLVAGVIGTKDVSGVTLALSQMVGRQLPLFSLLIPAYLVLVLAGWRRTLEVLPAVATAGITFAICQFLVSNFVGPELTDVVAALVTMGAVALLLRFWQPRNVYRSVTLGGGDPRPVAGDPRPVGGGLGEAAPLHRPASGDDHIVDPPGRVARAFAMYLILVIVILVGQMGNLPFFSGHPPGDVKTALHTPANVTADLKCGAIGFKLCPLPWSGPDPAKDRQAFKFPVWNFVWPGSYEMKNGKPVSLISREAPVVSKSTPYELNFNWDFLAAAGSLVVYASIIAFIVMALRGVPVMTFFTTYAATLRQLALPIITIAFILSISSIMNYSGMTATLAVALSKTGGIFPFVSAFLGMLGVFLTGSDTSSNTLFGPLQAQTAKLQHLNPILTAATNSSGGVMGKMISPQNLSVGAAGVNKVGAEGDIFRRVIGYSLILTSLMGLLAMFQAYVIPQVIPVVSGG